MDDRKDQGESDPDRIDVTGGDPKVDDRKDQGESDPDRIVVLGGDRKVEDCKDQGDSDLDCIVVSGSDPKVEDRKDQGDSDSDRVGGAGGDPASSCVIGGDMTSTDRSRWEKAIISFTILKNKIAKAPNLKHFDPDRPTVIVVYASKWAVSAALLQ